MKDFARLRLSIALCVLCAGVSGAHAATPAPSTPSAASPARPPAPSPSKVALAADGSASGGDIVDASGRIDPAAYVAMAGKMSSADGVAYRYGPASTAPRSGTTWHARPNSPRRHAADGGDWQVGGPDVSYPGDYFANFANVLYVADAPGARVGVADIQTLLQSFNTFTQRPQPAPLWAGRNPDLNNFEGLDDNHGHSIGAHNPVAAARCYGRPGWCLESVVAYQDGRLSTAVGSNTSANMASVQLAPNKVPTGIAQTNSAEFALVTVWDTVALKGQVAVVALAGLCNGCTVDKPNLGDVGWGERNSVNPGLANRGNIGFMKVLGYVDLPEGMRAPTEIAATTGWNPWTGRPMDGAGRMTTEYEMALSNESHRQSFAGAGRNSGSNARGGMAIVVSKSEKRAAFIDLKPLFDYYRRMYFGTRADFDKTTTVGMADKQWPYAFSQMADSDKPKVVQTIDLGARPTAVKATLWGSRLRGWIATEEGALRIFDLGGWGNGSGTGSLKQVGSVAVGANPTSIAYFRGSANDTGTRINETVMVLSRAERAVRWVDFSPSLDSGTVRRAVLTDSRLVDPVMIEDNENHGTEGWVLSLADFGGKAVRNYRYGPVIFWTNQGPGMACQPKAGCGLGPNNLPPAQYPFEYGGDMTLPGRPFFITSANVP
ncbi:hypothetical protein [Variovorax sp. OV329]|uniref:hypothetical protein n=1 Tax=Variovorax sp. OV329 TaxID=1882825 RepID=UPI0008F286AE|nr:hypothetical protein [Variovorax sp. OV329]SFL96283.1 hypothetical protein SAMN05444747_101480 [Variovorax sp. OV329]